MLQRPFRLENSWAQPHSEFYRINLVEKPVLLLVQYFILLEVF